AKFSEALKTVGKKFDFVQLYEERDKFKSEILQVIGRDLNGYVLDDAAIDYLEQTDKQLLNMDNILDAEGIKKITDLTAKQAMLENDIRCTKEKTIVKQNVSAKEAILELRKQEAEAEEKQKREISNIKARENAAAAKVSEEERLKAQTARIAVDEELSVAEENKLRQIIVAQKNKEGTEAVEEERVQKRMLLERTEKEKLVVLAQIDKEKAVEEEQKKIQEVIRERVIVEKAVVVEEEKIKDTREFAAADREKAVAVTQAEKSAQEALIKEVKAAEASREAAKLKAEERIIDAESKFQASEKEAMAIKTMADAKAQEDAIHGIGEARVIEAKAHAVEIDGDARARIIEVTGLAEAKAIEAKAMANAKEIEASALAEAKGKDAMVDVMNKQGTVEAEVMAKKYTSEANGITEKAHAMKLFDSVGKDHEEFKLRLDKEKSIDLAQIAIQKDIADAQASVINAALKSAKIDIVGGETMFFDKIVGSITNGKYMDYMVNKSKVLTDVKDTFITGDPEHFERELKTLVSRFNIGSDDLKNLSISALISKMIQRAEGDTLASLETLLTFAEKQGLGNKPASLIRK
ncbi:flotillin family protein, partial [Myxococcota bacterium]|nr:flotillin family protein [Myxococcota bacterium]